MLVKVNGVDVSDKILYESFVVEQNLDSKVDLARFDFVDYKVNVGDEVEIFNGSVK